jgi:hypothetical protein
MILGFVHNREAIVQLAVIGDQQKKQVFGVMGVVEPLMSIVGQSSGTVSVE